MASKVDPKEFWEGKIRTWETGRYERKKAPSLLESIADSASSSLRFRLRITGDVIAAKAPGLRVVELGCGSGMLASQIVKSGAASYVGIDISANAIAVAEERARADGIADKARFVTGGVSALADHPADLIFSIGLFDWLSDAELEEIFRASGAADYYHAIAEKRPELSRYIHSAYCWISYGWRNGGYVPRYLTVTGLGAMIWRHRDDPIWVARDPRLRFGALLTSWPMREMPGHSVEKR